VAVICIVNQTMQNTKTNNTMKTKIIIAGVIVAAISTMTLRNAQAQEQKAPLVKIIPTAQKDVIKVIYGYPLQETVEVKFTNREGVIQADKIFGKEFEGGFSKKYDVERMDGQTFWVEVSNNALSVNYKLTSHKNGRWSAQLEKTTYNHPIVALN
jgi:hypothetical protein